MAEGGKRNKKPVKTELKAEYAEWDSIRTSVKGTEKETAVGESMKGSMKCFKANDKTCIDGIIKKARSLSKDATKKGARKRSSSPSRRK